MESTFRYAKGRSYAYDYSADTEVRLPNGGAASSVRTAAKAIVSVISTCELVLKVTRPLHLVPLHDRGCAFEAAGRESGGRGVGGLGE